MIRATCFFIAALGLAAMLCGCQPRVEGGKHLDDAGEVDLTVDAAGVRVKTNRRFTATTQPSATGNGTFTLHGVGDALGGLTFKPTVEKFKNAWQLGLLFLAIAGGMWWLKRYVWCGLIFALGVLTILNPALMAWTSAAAAAIGVWLLVRTNIEQMNGTAAVLEAYPAAEGTRIKDIARGKHSPSTQAVIKARFGKT